MINFKGGKACFCSQFQKFQSLVSWIHCSWICGKAEHYGKECVEEQSCSPRGSLEAKKKEEGTRVPVSPSRVHLQGPDLLPLGPYFLKGLPSPNSAIDWEPSLYHTDLCGAITNYSIQCKERPGGPGNSAE